MEAAESAREKMDFESFRPGDAIEVTVDAKNGSHVQMNARGESKVEEVFRGVCIAKHNDYYNSTFTIRCVGKGAMRSAGERGG